MGQDTIGGHVIRKDRRYVMLQRHLQQSKPEGACPTDWGSAWPLKWEVVTSQAQRIQDAYTRDLTIAFAGVSKLTRTLQTMALVVPQARRIERMEALTPLDYHNERGTWNSLASLKTETAEEIEGLDPKLFSVCGNQVVAAIFAACGEIRNGEIAFLVSHNPLCEAGLVKFLGSISKMPFANFAKGDIVLFEFENGRQIDAHFLLVPPEPDKQGIVDRPPHL